jgi:hypothetical protein
MTPEEREAYRATARERQREAYKQNPEKFRRQARESYHRNPENDRRYQLRRKYGITLEDYERLHTAQGGRCAICDDEVELGVDHDHLTGEVRALLCNGCNTAIGLLRENPILTEKALEYLRAHPKRFALMPESKAGNQIPKSFDAFVKSDWFRRALSQSQRACPVGMGVLPAVVIRGDWCIVDIRGRTK